MTPRAWSLFGVVSLLWGVPYLLINMALSEGVGPLWAAATRVALAALVLAPFALLTPRRATLGGRWWKVFLLAVVEIVVPFSVIPLGEQKVSSGVTGVLIATEPMFVLILGFILGSRSRPTATALFGLVTGFVGVAVSLGVDGAETSGGMIILAAAFYGLGAVLVVRWFGDVPPITLVTAMMGLAAPVLLVMALFTGHPTLPTTTGFSALLALGLISTPAGFVAFFKLIALAGPDRAALITYVAPVVAVAAGALVLGESVGVRTAIGASLIVLGAWAATRTGRSTSERTSRISS